jgi:hypothetical protein
MRKNAAIGANFDAHIYNIQKNQKQLPFTVHPSPKFCKLEIFIYPINRLLWKEPTNAVNPAVRL